MKLLIHGQTCHLMPQRAIFWEEEQTLILSDIHIGKSAVFRRFGIPIPEGSTKNDLVNLMILLDQFKPKKCVIVGDLIHAKSGLSAEVTRMFSEFLHGACCETHLVMGNHDRALAKKLPEEWPLYLHKELLFIEPFVFSHHPLANENGFVWAGHLHPKVELKSLHDRLVLRCFQIFPNLGILPAFGEFVGGSFVKKNEGCQIYAIANSKVIKI
ncbi:MAG: ligase-associated DNA damage response endonuclease PdeM [Candidatus Protochlamydia sp.]|nr:ligase-associated DNA damage response endonuclease PdeM [Candidatus Protochlamydia sp.]